MSKFVLSAFADEIDDSLSTQMDVLEQHGIKYIEMRGVNGKSLVKHNINDVKQIKKELDDRGFKISAIGSPVGKIGIKDDFGPHLDLFKHTIEIAQVLDTGFIRMFSFFIPEGEDAGSYRDEVMDRWGKFIDTAKGTGLILLHENEKEIYGDIPERCLDLHETMNSDIMKATFDFANFVQCDCKVYPDAYMMLKDHIAYIHIKDAKFSDYSVVPAGYGDGQISEVLAVLKEGGFEGFLSLEPHLGTFTGFTELEAGLYAGGLPESGPDKFAVAVAALKTILEDIGCTGI